MKNLNQSDSINYDSDIYKSCDAKKSISHKDTGARVGEILSHDPNKTTSYEDMIKSAEKGCECKTSNSKQTTQEIKKFLEELNNITDNIKGNTNIITGGSK